MTVEEAYAQTAPPITAAFEVIVQFVKMTEESSPE